MSESRKEMTEMSVVKIMDEILAYGFRTNASDIHIEPREDRTMVRVRRDGLLLEHTVLERGLHPALVARTKIMAGMDIAEKRLPQDGHFKMFMEKTEINVRVSTIPTIYGEKAVLRFLNTAVSVDFAETFGMNRENYKKVQKILGCPHGILYLTGPTGSGKTTTLYMILEQLRCRPVNIVTIEEPVERIIDGISQIQVNRQAGLTFESGLRAVLRQDPDIIMVGETRDNQTALISARAAITGHLVLSTLHTNDAVGAITRLMDMGLEPYLAADSLIGVMAQRLVRKICPYCKKQIPISEKHRRILGETMKTVWEGGGCSYCDGTGYMGRIAVHEVVFIDKNIRKMIAESRPEKEIYDYVERVQKMTALKENVLQLIRSGITTIEEFDRITYGE